MIIWNVNTRSSNETETQIKTKIAQILITPMTLSRYWKLIVLIRADLKSQKIVSRSDSFRL